MLWGILHTSIGISLYPNEGKDVESLLKNADTAMYRAKDPGRNIIAFYSSEMNALAVKKLNMEIELCEALNQQQFELYYQPQYDATGVEIKGCEALLRADTHRLLPRAGNCKSGPAVPYPSFRVVPVLS